MGTIRQKFVDFSSHNEKKIFIVFLFLTLLALVSFWLADQRPLYACPTPASGEECPEGNVKYVVGQQDYDYTDGSAQVNVIPGTCCRKNSVTWQAAECYEITNVCVKVDGICGSFLEYPDPTKGSAGPYNYNISQVVLSTRYTCEQEPTPSEELNPTPTQVVPTPTPERGHELGGPPVCGAETPNAPYLKSATALGGNKVKLVWDPVEKATHYSISYGPDSGNYPWGVFNTGNTTEYTIEGVSGGCFAVKAVNDCAPSGLSNEVCTGAAPQVLGLSTTSGENQLEAVAFWIGILVSLLGVKTLATQLSLLSNEK